MSGNMLTRIINRLVHVPGVAAIVLGGSRARGTHTPSSDYDLGLYYSPDRPIDIPALQLAARELDDRHQQDLVTPLGGWGPWINGGGWLTIEQTPVDLLYRDLDRVSRIIDECRLGYIEVAYQPGHPHCFVSSIYMAEVAVCQVLEDPRGILKSLKERTQPFPPELKRALIERFWWETDFSIKVAAKSIQRADNAYAAGCCFRSVACLLQTLFALNETYWLNEKGALAIAEGFAIKPRGLESRVQGVIAGLKASPEALSVAIGELQTVVKEMEALVASD